MLLGPEAQIAHLTETLGYFLPSGSRVWIPGSHPPQDLDGIHIAPLIGSDVEFELDENKACPDPLAQDFSCHTRRPTSMQNCEEEYIGFISKSAGPGAG